MGSQSPIIMGGGTNLEGSGALSNIATERVSRDRWIASQPGITDRVDLFPHTVRSIRTETEELSVGGDVACATVTATGGITAASFTLSSPRWDDLLVPVTSTKLGGTKDPHFAVFKTNGSGSQGVFTYLFDKTSEEELYFSVQVPHCWYVESALEPHVHWCPIDTDAGTVRWGLEYTMATIGGTFGNTTITYTTATAAGGTAYAHKLSDLGSLTMTDMGISTMILCRIFRDVANDTYNNDAALLQIDFHYRTDTPGGSDAETSKT